MALTPTEFSRQLQPLLSGASVEQTEATSWLLRRPEQIVEITCQPLPAVQLGALRLPRLEVALRFHGGDATQQDAFVAGFMDCFRRGGG